MQVLRGDDVFTLRVDVSPQRLVAAHLHAGQTIAVHTGLAELWVDQDRALLVDELEFIPIGNGYELKPALGGEQVAGGESTGSDEEHRCVTEATGEVGHGLRNRKSNNTEWRKNERFRQVAAPGGTCGGGSFCACRARSPQADALAGAYHGTFRKAVQAQHRPVVKAIAACNEVHALTCTDHMVFGGGGGSRCSGPFQLFQPLDHGHTFGIKVRAAQRMQLLQALQQRRGEEATLQGVTVRCEMQVVQCAAQGISPLQEVNGCGTGLHGRGVGV